MKQWVLDDPTVSRSYLEISPDALLIVGESGKILDLNRKAEALFNYPRVELVGQSIEVLVPDHLKAPHTGFRKEYMVSPENRMMNSVQRFSAKQKDGALFSAEISLHPVEARDGVVVLASVRDVTDWAKTQYTLAEKVTQLEALHDIGIAISSTQDLESLLNLIVEQAVNLVGASSCSVLMPESESGELVFLASVDNIVGMRVPRGMGVVSRVLKSGKPEIVNNVASDPDHYTSIDANTHISVTSLLAVPLLTMGKTIGVLTAVNKKEGNFVQADCDMLMTLASHAAVSIQRSRLYEQVQRHAEELEAQVDQRTVALRESETLLKQRNLELNRLYRASETLYFSQVPAVEHLAQKIVGIILAEFGQSNCSLLLTDEHSSELQRIAVLGPYADEVSQGKLHLDGPGLVPRVFRLGEIINVPDVRKNPDYVPNWKAARSELAIPLKVGDRVIGVIDVQSKDINAFGENDERLMSIFAERAAMALENARLFEAERRRRDEAETLRQAGAVIAATLQQGEAIRRILIELERVVPYDSASVQLVRDGALEIVGGRGWHDPSKVIGVRFPIPGDNPNTEVIQQRAALIIDDTRDHFPIFLQAPHNHIKSWLGAPLVVRGRVIGMLAVDSSQVHFYNHEHMRLVMAFADQVAIAIDNTQLFEQTQRTLAETQILYKIARSLIHTESLEDLLESVVDHVAADLPADQVVLITFDLTACEVTHCVISGKGIQNAIIGDFDRLWNGLSGWVLRELRPVQYSKDDVGRGADYLYEEQWLEEQVGASVVVPLIYREKAFGTLTVLNRPDQGDFSQHDVSLLETIANQAAIAIENARLFEEIQWLATTDSLTGINNRRRLFELGRIEIERARRYGHPLSAIMLDIDHFKAINDTHGHGVGDQVLHSLAQECLKSIREFDVLGRYGGEEFAIILPETYQEEAVVTAERLRQSIQNTQIETTQDTFAVTISLGVAEMTDDIQEVAAMLDRADSALYAAKQAGRNCVRVSD